MKARFKCGNIVRRVDTGRCGTCGDSLPVDSILRVLSDEDDAGVVRVHYPQGDEDEEIQEVMWYEIELLPTEAKVEKSMLEYNSGYVGWLRCRKHYPRNPHPIGHSSFRKLGQRNCPVDG